MRAPTRRPKPPPNRQARGIDELLAIMARLRAPDGCPWDREQNHQTLRFHAVEEVYELLDAIDAGDDQEMEEELGDLLLQIVFHCQLASERGAFGFDDVARRLVAKLVHRHPHVFGDAQAKTAAAVWAQWDRLKHAEKQGTPHERTSTFDGIPKHLPALLRAQKLWKKAAKTHLTSPSRKPARRGVIPQVEHPHTRREMARELFALARVCQENGWNAEDLLRTETNRLERLWRRKEQKGRA